MSRTPVRSLTASLILLGGACGLPLPAAEPAPAPARAAAFSRPEDIPVDHFFRDPAIRSPRLNGAGTHVAMIVHESGKDARGLLFLSLDNGTMSGIRGGGSYDVARFDWAGDRRVVFSVVRDNLFSWGLYAMTIDEAKKVIPLNNYDVIEVLGSSRARPENLLVYVARSARDQGRPGGLQELDLRRGHTNAFGSSGNNIMNSLPLPPGDRAVRWFRDRERELRYAITHEDADLKLYRRMDGDRWKEVPLDLDRLSPLAVGTDPATLYVARATEQGGRELRVYHTETKELGPVLYADEKYDFSRGSLRHADDAHELIGIVYARQATEQIWFRSEDAELQQALNATLPANRLNQIVSRSRDGERILILSSSDRHPGSLYLLQRSTLKLRRITDLAPWLPENLLAPVRLMTYRTRDGLQLDGYVTLPLSHQEGRPSPMVVLPHGGPWARDTWGYDPQSQFLASRGYVVFRPNYRGSSGYNVEISLRPRMEFRKMHDDVTDGVRALIASGIADRQRIAIFGSSFGGYLAVAGVAFEPDLYRCAASFAGVFDLATMIKDDGANENDYRRAWFRRDFGDPKQNAERFEALSPLQHVAQIKVPLFVAHGREDRNADTGQSRRLVRALKAAGVEHETLFISGEAHGLAAMKNRVEFYQRLEAFLKKHL